MIRFSVIFHYFTKNIKMSIGSQKESVVPMGLDHRQSKFPPGCTKQASNNASPFRLRTWQNYPNKAHSGLWDNTPRHRNHLQGHKKSCNHTVMNNGKRSRSHYLVHKGSLPSNNSENPFRLSPKQLMTPLPIYQTDSCRNLLFHQPVQKMILVVWNDDFHCM
jgi:hypothetical protein